MSPARELHRRETGVGKKIAHWLHAQIGVEQDIALALGDALASVPEIGGELLPSTGRGNARLKRIDVHRSDGEDFDLEAAARQTLDQTGHRPADAVVEEKLRNKSDANARARFTPAFDVLRGPRKLRTRGAVGSRQRFH